MRFTFAYGLAALPAVSAHTLFTTLFINDVNQGDVTCVRMPMSPGNATGPVAGIEDIEMACGNGGNTYVPRACPADSGLKLSFLFRDTPDGSTPGAIDASHKGPCAVYMKYVETPAVSADGGSWFKIWDDGYDNATSKWCTEKVIDNQGLISVKLPNNLADGYYLVRTELLALHEADKTPPDPQFYVGCAQIFLGSSNATNGVLPNNTVSIPGYLRSDDPSVNFNIYKPSWPYIMPGPPPFSPGDSVKVVPRVDHNMSFLATSAAYTNANWWAVDLDPYSTADGCWNASAACFNQTTMCYNTAPPTGSGGCMVWEDKCNVIQAACNTSNFNGPPDAFKALTRPSQVNHTIPPAGNLTDQLYAGQYAPVQVSASLNSARLASNSTSAIMAVPTLNVALTLTASNFSPTASLITTSSSSSSSLQPTSSILVNSSSIIASSNGSFSSLASIMSGKPRPLIDQGPPVSPSISTVFSTTLLTSTFGRPMSPPSSVSTVVSTSPSVTTSMGSSSESSSSTTSSRVTTSPTSVTSLPSSSTSPTSTFPPPSTTSIASDQSTSSSSNEPTSTSSLPTSSTSSSLSSSASNSSSDTAVEIITILPSGDGALATSAPSTTSSAFIPTSTIPVSTDGKCGADANGGTTCLGSMFGQCCSGDGICGATTHHCFDGGCQGHFGMCLYMQGSAETAIATAALPPGSAGAARKKRSKKSRLEEATARHVEYVGKLKRGRHHWMRRLL